MGCLNQTVTKVENKIIDEFGTRTIRRLVSEKFGYPLEMHHYYTKDGFINTVYRIPGVKGTKEN